MCLKCDMNYTRQGDSCNLCEADSKQMFYMIGSLIIGIIMFSYLIYKTIKGKGNPKNVSSGIIKIALRQFQLLGIISQFPLSWSNEIKAMFSGFNTISNAGSAAFSVDCFMKSSYTIDSLLNLLIPLVILVFFLVLIGWYYQNSVKCKRYMILSSIVILMTLHPTLVKQVLGFFKCSSPILGKLYFYFYFNFEKYLIYLVIGSMYLLADIDVKCGSSEHRAMVWGLGIPAFIIYTLGIPCIAGIYLYLKRHKLSESETRQTIGFLYADYQSQYYWWELIVILRLVALATIGVLYEGNNNFFLFAFYF